MLQKHTVSKSLLRLLKDLQSDIVFKDYFLVGGTALSLQIGHRISDDIDLLQIWYLIKMKFIIF